METAGIDKELMKRVRKDVIKDIENIRVRLKSEIALDLMILLEEGLMLMYGIRRDECPFLKDN
jgi:hypothetical protein